MVPEGKLMIHFFGEGKTDLGGTTDPELPAKGVLPILVSTLCGGPGRMLVQRESVAFLQGKGLWQKVRCAKRKARGGDGAVFLVDSEGDAALHKRKLEKVKKGRDAAMPDFPMAVGVAQPCIESWLLADADAVRRGLGLANAPAVPEKPEELPAPCKDRRQNPKAVLAAVSGVHQQDLSAESKDAITAAMRDMPLVRSRCPLSFAPFADEVENRIRPLF